MKLKVLLFATIFILAAFFRLYGSNWDQNNHLHPDERFLTMVSTSIKWPKSQLEYFNTSTSTLNPHNKDFPFFVYGTFPIFITKYIAEILNLGDYQNITLVGRLLSAYMDLGTVVLVFFIAKQAIESRKQIHNSYFIIHNSFFPLLAMFFYAAMVLPIQLSHFFAVDTYLTFFLTLSFYLISKLINSKPGSSQSVLYISLLGISYGLALSSKISAILFFPIIGIGILYALIRNKNIVQFVVLNALFLLFVYITLRFAQPYLFQYPNLLDLTPNQKMMENWKTLETFNDPSGWYPPAIQWIATKPYIFPLKNMLLWGLGLPLGILALSSVIFSIYAFMHFFIHALKKKSFQIHNSSFIILSLCLLWIILLMGYQGMQFVKALRYFYPVYPFIAILSGWFITHVFAKLKTSIFALLYCCIVALILIYPLSFISIYTNPHTRVQASNWIYENIPSGSVIANEYWDDPLPLFLKDKNPAIYEGMMLPLYDADTEEKWKKLSEELKHVDYIVLSSNRLYGSILTVPEKYPLTTKYYQSLFDGSLGFKKVAEFTSRPNLPIPGINICLTPPFTRYGIIAHKTQDCTQKGISFVDDYADETFTVYDHPKVLIFKRSPSPLFNN